MAEAASGSAYRIEAVTFRYPGAGDDALQEVTLDIPTGSFSAVIGPNGAGKSTLVRLLGGTLLPVEGSVRLMNQALSKWKPGRIAQQVAVVSQDAPPAALRLSVGAYVELGRNPYVSAWAPLSRNDRDAVGRALAQMELESWESRLLSDLSGGERQRAKLARALAQEPRILILDEPTVHLDFRHALWVFEALRGWVRKESLTVVCITHDMQLASRYADQLILLSKGRVVATGAPGAVLGSPELAGVYGCDIRVRSMGELGYSVLPVALRPSNGTSP